MGVGKVRKNSRTTALFRVDNSKDLQTIIDHFNNENPLWGFCAKLPDFLLFEQCYNLIKQKQHLTLEGLEQILALKSNLNKGLTDDLKSAFPHVMPVERPEYQFNGIPHPSWLAGFASGDSSFSVSLEKSNTKLGQRVRLIFGTHLHIRDKELLFGIGYYLKNFNLDSPDQFNSTSLSNLHVNISSSVTKSSALLQIKNFSDIVDRVIPFFDRYPILGVKSLDFKDFKRVAVLVQNKEHLTVTGLSKIIRIVAKLNLDRDLASNESP